MIRQSIEGFLLLVYLGLSFFPFLRLPDPNEQGWKDVVRVDPNDVVTIWVPFRETVCLPLTILSLLPRLNLSQTWPACLFPLCISHSAFFFLDSLLPLGICWQLCLALSFAGARGPRHDAPHASPARVRG